MTESGNVPNWRGRGYWRNRGKGQWRGRGYWRGKAPYRYKKSSSSYTDTPVPLGDQSQSSSVSSTPSSSSDVRALAKYSDPQPRLIQTTLSPNCSYKGWLLYFPHDTYDTQSDIIKKTKLCERYCRALKSNLTLDIEEKRYFVVDYKHFSSDSDITHGWPDFAHELVEHPQTALSILGLAIHQVLHEQKLVEVEKHCGSGLLHIPREDPTDMPPKINIRLHNFDTVTPLKNLKANCYGKFVCVKGTVVRVSNTKPLCTKMAFECNTCGEQLCLELIDGKYAVPTRCNSTECRGRTFTPQRGSPFTQTVDWQTIRLQELNSEEHKESGRVPRIVDCELTEDLVDCCVPGDTVSVSGIVKVNAADDGRGGKGKDKCLFVLYIRANSVVNAKVGHDATGSPSSLAVEFSMKELYAIREIQAEPRLFRLLVASLCPTICGHEMVKAGLLLGLFGSHQKYANHKNSIPVRGDIHVLVVGDPGLGKSQMLQAVSNVAPRSVYVCGNTTTTAGLTVTVCKDGPGGDHSLEAGALVLADQGCCCIDEFDKMTSQHQALLEAMEQQSISIAKAGIVCSLPARTTIIAAANPIGGHYNKAKTVSENLKLGGALLSRFDLVFILLDKPDEEMDGVLSDHVVALHSGSAHDAGLSFSSSKHGQAMFASQSHDGGDRALRDRLKVQRGESIDPIPHTLLRKYVGYARKYVTSKIGPEAAKVLQTFYLELRREHQTGDSTPITTRQLESLIRLTEARARLELREVATEGDARDVVELMKYSMSDTFSDEFGCLDFSRSQHGSGMSGGSKPKRFVAALQRVADRTLNSIFTLMQMKQIAKDIALQVADFEAFISSLNNHGYLLKKGPRIYQLQTADY